MKRTALLIDNSACLTKEDIDFIKPAKIVPITFVIDKEIYEEGSNLSREDFFKFLESDAKISTSQPSIELVKDVWRDLLKEYDEVLYVLIASGLSGSYDVASKASLDEEFKGKVFVCNNKQVAQTNKMAFYEARYLIDNGESAERIKNQLEAEDGDSRIYLAVSTLKFLKKSGRVNALEATVGTLLNIKPIIRFEKGHMFSHSKVISMGQAKQKLIQLLKNEIETHFANEALNGTLRLAIAHSFADENAKELKAFEEFFKKSFPNLNYMSTESLPLFIICHTGPNAIGVGFVIDRYNLWRQ